MYKYLYYGYKYLTDYELIKYINSYVKPGMRVIDIGANIGFYTEILARKVGEKGKVYSFEPDGQNFNNLYKNTKKYINTEIYKYAVSSKTGIINLYLSNSFNSDHRTYNTGENRKQLSVKAISIDEFIKSKNIDFIKIDIQGYDLYAMKGAEKLIKYKKHISIVGEFWPYGLKQANCDPQDYLNFFKKNNMNLKLLSTRPIKKVIDNKHFYTNFIAYK